MASLTARSWRRTVYSLAVYVAAVAGLGGTTSAATPAVGFLLAQDPADRVAIQVDVACQLAKKLASATLLLSTADGRLVDAQGQTLTLDRFQVLWCHQTDLAKEPGVASPPLVDQLRQFVGQGRGLLLTGGAAGLAVSLQLDTLRVQPIKMNQDYGQAGLVPVDVQHPVFQGLDFDRGVLWMTNAVFPAFDKFQPARKTPQGRLLARSTGTPEIPLLEYALGQGRVLVMGWQHGRLYDDAPAEYQANFEQLTGNLVRYLADARRWQPLTAAVDNAPMTTQIPAVPDVEWQNLELAIRDLAETFRDRYPHGTEYLRRLAELKQTHGSAVARDALVRRFDALRGEALLANPLLDFARLLLVRRGVKQLGLPLNYTSNSSLPKTGYDNQIAVLSPVRPGAKLTTLFRPTGGRFVGDLKLHFDADRMLFSMPGDQGCWRVCEIRADGSGLRELPLIDEPDVDNYDACYLPDGRIVFGSTACFAGVPCTNGAAHVSNLYLRETDGRIRQLTVEQDHDWCPTVLNNGRLLYQRWEYTDLPHTFSRILFHMNPDGTEQMEYYGSNSYWPASMFYARPIPGHPTKVVAVVGGHHDLPRMGELVVLDPARGRFEADGAVARIPGRGRKVAPTMLDLAIAQSWPKFLHPWPLSAKYFLVSCKLSPDALWGIYLVDVFDNFLLLCEEPGYALLEPIPLRKTPRPPVVPDRVDLARRDAEVLIADLYHGEGLRGVPRGTIKQLRVISYQYGYQGMGAEPYSVGLDGPWDPKLILGTVPVLEDGSARFRVPAYTPIALQPLDAEGKAVQLMRSWFTAMPGETVSCVGCHEKQNTAPPVRKSLAATRPPAAIEPWLGPARGFAFRREVQPVLDRYCVGCHNGQPRTDGLSIPSLVDGPSSPLQENKTRINQASRFSPSYYQLRRYVRTPTKEADLHLLPPWEFHADTTRLVQLLDKGHYGVQLDAEARARLYAWIDLNAPCHGTWTDLCGVERPADVARQWERRRAMRKLFTGMDDNPEAIFAPPAIQPRPAVSAPAPALGSTHVRPTLVSVVQPTRHEPAGQAMPRLSFPLGEGVSLELVRVPAGEFTMGQADGCADERPLCRVKIDAPFWMGRCEVTNEQFARFDPTHRSRLEHGDFLQFSPGERGWTLSRPTQPVVRVSWLQAMAFCRWLSQRTGRHFTLPTEAQWEYACRAGTTTPLWYGTLDSDFARVANLADASHQAIERFGEYSRPETIPAWRPADARYDDRSRVSAAVGSYGPNPWGLCDMHGNGAEWTRSKYAPYPYRELAEAAAPDPNEKRVVRGGSWYDRPDRCRAAFRQAYPACRPVYDVGFRVICTTDVERVAQEDRR
jgi:formylglycine-generating enzyme required for sulfatase activity